MQSHFSLQRQDSKSLVPLEQTLEKHSQHTVLAQIPHKLARITKILRRHGIPISLSEHYLEQSVDFRHKVKR